jgi:hypothetical protein
VIIGTSALAVVALLVGAAGYTIYESESGQVHARPYSELRVTGDLKTEQILAWRRNSIHDVATDSDVAFLGIDLRPSCEEI